MKKVAFIYAGSAGRGGLSTYLKLLFKHLKSDKFELVLLSIGPWETSTQIEKEGHKVIFLHPSRVFSLKTLTELKKIIKNEEISVLLTAGMVSNFYGRVASLFSKNFVITTVHSAWKTDYPGIFKRIIFFLSDRFFRFKTKKYIAVSNYIKKELIKEGVSEDKIDVIYNGVSINSDIKQKSLDSKEISIGSVGRLHYTKGFDVLIKAMNNLPESATLKIWGDGIEKDNLNKLIMELNLDKRVRLMGRAEKVEKVFSEIDIYVQPSRMEGFGLTVVEAMMAGVPVVVSDNGSLPEIVKDGKTGLVSNLNPEDLAEKIDILSKDEKLRENLAKQAKVTATKEFSIENWVKKMADSIAGALK